MMENSIGTVFCGGAMWLFWIFLAVVIVWAVKTATRNSNSHPDNQKSALDILKERYAKGEITQADFEQMHKDLAGN